MNQKEFALPSPLTEVQHSCLKGKNIRLFIKRDDLIHPDISGNKWRKLQLNIEQAIQRGNDTILTFGGAHSNHIAATAAAGNKFGLKTIGIIRGEEADLENPTLGYAREQGMLIHRISRTEFREIGDWNYIESLRQKFGSFYLIPQGGANFYGVQGCMEIIKELPFVADRIFVGCGTGTTLSGLALANKAISHIYGVSALKGGAFLRDEVSANVKKVINDFETEAFLMEKICILDQYHFGGYARISGELIAFMQQFYQETGIKTDPVYTSKAAWALIDFAEANPPTEPEKWVLIHTGGLQGIPAMEQREGMKIYPDC